MYARCALWKRTVSCGNISTRDTKKPRNSFVNSKAGGRQAEDIVFFFDSDKKKIDTAYNAIADGISIAKQPTTPIIETPAVVQQPVMQQPVVQSSVADEILKFKNLLDMGAITQEEFDEQKNKLLNK